jgi:hypothetical protein
MVSSSLLATIRIGLKMGSERFAAIVAGLLIAASSSALAGKGEGIVLYYEGKPTTLRTTSKLTVGAKLVMQYPGPDGGLLCCVGATVTGKIGSAEIARSHDHVTDILRKAAVLGYRLKLDNKKTFNTDFDAAAVVAPKLGVRQLSPEQLEIGTGPGSTKVEICLSQEGQHLITHKAGTVGTHLYLGFNDYSVEPTCSDEVRKLFKAKR